MDDAHVPAKEILMFNEPGASFAPDVSEVLRALEGLRSRSGPEVYDKLLDAMGHEVRSIRERASDIFVEMGRAAAEHARQVLGRLNSDQVFWALSSVVRIEGDLATSWLVSLYSSPEAAEDAMLRSAVINAVGMIKGEASVEFLMKALGDGSWPNRYSAAEALEKKGQQTVGHLKKAFSEGHGDIKFWTLQLFVRILKEASSGLLKSCLSLEEPDIRYYGLQALGESDEDWATQLLLEGFKDAHWANRRLTQRLLMGKGKNAVLPLIRAMETANIEMLHDILMTMGKIGDERLVRPVANLMVQAEGHRAGEVRSWCIEALASVRNEMAVRRLTELVQEFPEHAPQVQEALAPLGSVAARLLMKGLMAPDEGYKTFCRDTIGRMDLPGARSLAFEIERLESSEADRVLRQMKSFPADGLEEVLRDGSLTAEKVRQISSSGAFDAEASAISKIEVAVSEDEVSKFVRDSGDRSSRRLSTYPVTLDDILTMAIERTASDIHLKVGIPPVVRISGKLTQDKELPPISKETIWEIITKMIPDVLVQQLLADKELDMSYEISGVSRFRVNIYSEVTGYALAIRLIPDNAPRLEDLGVPKVFWSFCNLNQGLILISGPTGSGKSTTLAALINQINETRELHVLTIEDPIEFRHHNKKCLITSRELGVNTNSFARALRGALREDPDVILVGEMRDFETVYLALTASETGHLVFSTIHTSSAPEGVERLINVFPGEQHDAARNLISQTLNALVCQTLVPTTDGGRAAALEVMVNTYGIANLIREKKINQIDSAILTGRQDGMITRDDHLFELCMRRGIITRDTALLYCRDRKALEDKFGGAQALGSRR